MDSPLYHKHSDQTSDHGSGNLNPLRIVDSSQFWAVIIGIDGYPTPQDILHSCVRDATNVFEYLTINMGVPEDHVKLLLSPQPSNVSSILLPIRAHIIDTLLSLSTNPRIHYGDNIVIYYAGHGAVYHCKTHPAFASLGKTGTIEALCPMDRNTTKANDGNCKPIPDISDREIYTILDEIRRTKGHHITVILDCCHSSSQTRVPGGSIQGRREVRPLPGRTSIADMFAVADKKLGELKTGNGYPRYQSISGADWVPEIPVTSHVILAACKAFEYATELRDDPGRSGGVFTVALLSSLKSVIDKPAGLNGKLPTYRELVKSLPANNYGQHPVVAGECMNNPLWYTVWLALSLFAT
ncbi:uncharacterized protein ARMOST_21329 [Armillaria ostoyae]|uniref:Peptidase C14 caspase domain-containing protein n=1 Tax=Armillaria ostoyae TaxID=47428 RepID=A0A284S9T0_ARMOS|nr:uncharacterized protein ARMOST_21329 [Armillaria ostoyae]